MVLARLYVFIFCFRLKVHKINNLNNLSRGFRPPEFGARQFRQPAYYLSICKRQSSDYVQTDQ
jgi:hypothetical protein